MITVTDSAERRVDPAVFYVGAYLTSPGTRAD